ncbi:snoaL-like domain-containing protein [Trichonephila clavata]|uniref:SnoaL-like domain-containing protein n=1 Tax=Trichonephila clavata TaxID=2740835 RepID=A0A8X6J174_TRICU|nr:snoaL-like domain-containing protein [Trichonephila clavata]GFR17429.1 snoaL-like domain-containing protein [Trichonephila clavata]GFR24996.1 snoaL-like domain-containing protein [Trichonephila clavata]
MVNQNLNKAESYYMAMYTKSFDEMSSYIHPHVCFIGPLATFNGKESVVEAAKNFSMFFRRLTIRERFISGNKVMLVLDFDCSDPVGTLRGASFLSFGDGLISRIELFYDARPFEKKKDEIFTQN